MSEDTRVDMLKGMGIHKRFKTYEEDGFILLQTSKPAKIVDGTLLGCEICIFDKATLKVWTSQKQKGKRIAAEHGLPVVLLDGEAEVMVPTDKADELLPLFGAKVKRSFSPEAMERLRAQGKVLAASRHGGV